jgi:tRNA-Thr(GGU) m(6)t(6)A37 methyltransferase TsaA
MIAARGDPIELQMTAERHELRLIGRVESTLTDPATAPKQGTEGGVTAWLEFTADVGAGLVDIRPGDELTLLTWLDRADRDVLTVHPRDDETQPLTGVFSTRSSDRPNPIGLHRVTVTEVDGLRVRVTDLEAIDGTPIVDIKPVLHRDADE